MNVHFWTQARIMFHIIIEWVIVIGVSGSYILCPDFFLPRGRLKIFNSHVQFFEIGELTCTVLWNWNSINNTDSTNMNLLFTMSFTETNFQRISTCCCMPRFFQLVSCLYCSLTEHAEFCFQYNLLDCFLGQLFWVQFCSGIHYLHFSTGGAFLASYLRLADI